MNRSNKVDRIVSMAIKRGVSTKKLLLRSEPGYQVTLDIPSVKASLIFDCERELLAQADKGVEVSGSKVCYQRNEDPEAIDIVAIVDGKCR